LYNLFPSSLFFVQIPAAARAAAERELMEACADDDARAAAVAARGGDATAAAAAAVAAATTTRPTTEFRDPRAHYALIQHRDARTAVRRASMDGKLLDVSALSDERRMQLVEELYTARTGSRNGGNGGDGSGGRGGGSGRGSGISVDDIVGVTESDVVLLSAGSSVGGSGDGDGDDDDDDDGRRESIPLDSDDAKSS
jgi:uncharacterized membrane protein YgcG